MKSKKTRIIVIEYHPHLREGIKVVLGRNPRFEIIGEAGTARDGLEKVKKLNPDLVTVGLSLPDQNGIDLISEMLDCRPGLPILVISTHSKIEYVIKTIRAGAMGYFLKKSTPENLVKAVDTLSQGEYYLDSTLSDKIVQYLKCPTEVETVRSDEAYETLTEKEKEIMKWVVGGTSRRAIAEKLYMSQKTVENHVSRIMKKLDIHNVYEMLRYSMKLKLIDVDLWE